MVTIICEYWVSMFLLISFFATLSAILATSFQSTLPMLCLSLYFFSPPPYLTLAVFVFFAALPPDDVDLRLVAAILKLAASSACFCVSPICR